MRALRLTAAAAVLATLCACTTVQHDATPRYMPIEALLAKSVATTPCGQPLGHYLDTTSTCDPEVIDDRAFAAHRLQWRGRPWLVVNRGNELQLWDVADPRHPMIRSSSRFNVGNQGDSDFDAMAFSVCDDCRWGVAWFKLATVVFDLGTNSQPTWADWRVIPDAISGQGGATWYHGRDQWVATSSLGGSCAGSTVYTIAGLSALTEAGCVTAAGLPVTVVRGLYDRGSLYLVSSSTKMHHYLAGGAGLTWRAEIGRAAVNAYGVPGLDAVSGLLVAASASGTRLWDTADPALPILTATLPGAAYVATLSPPLLVTAVQTADQHRERAWDVTDPASPVAVTADLWPDTHACSMYQSSTLTGDVLVSWRWSIAETFDLADCVEPAPVAEVFLDGFESGSTSAWSVVE